jgi:hypothetical protein
MKIFGWLVSIVSLGWFIWDLLTRRSLLPAEAAFPPGAWLGWTLELVCLASGVYLIKNGRRKSIFSLSIVCFFLLLLLAGLNILAYLYWAQSGFEIFNQ